MPDSTAMVKPDWPITTEDDPQRVYCSNPICGGVDVHPHYHREPVAARDSSLDGVRGAVLAEFWAALAADSRRAVDGWFWHEDELNDVLRSFGLLDRNEVFRGQ